MLMPAWPPYPWLYAFCCCCIRLFCIIEPRFKDMLFPYPQEQRNSGRRVKQHVHDPECSSLHVMSPMVYWSRYDHIRAWRPTFTAVVPASEIWPSTIELRSLILNFNPR